MCEEVCTRCQATFFTSPDLIGTSLFPTLFYIRKTTQSFYQLNRNFLLFDYVCQYKIHRIYQRPGFAKKWYDNFNELETHSRSMPWPYHQHTRYAN